MNTLHFISPYNVSDSFISFSSSDFFQSAYSNLAQNLFWLFFHWSPHTWAVKVRKLRFNKFILSIKSSILARCTEVILPEQFKNY